MKVLAASIVALSVIAHLAAAQDPGVTVYDGAGLFQAICDQQPLIWIGADIALREEYWPANCSVPVVLSHNMTISGPLDQPIKYTIQFNFIARKVQIPAGLEWRLRHLTASNTRRGGGGSLDFVAYSPKGIVWTEDVNKNQITCVHADPASLASLPMPVNNDYWAGKQQNMSLWPDACFAGRCWQEVLHYEQFATDVDVGSDAATGGYILAKLNASKTCDEFINNTCMTTIGGEQCMQNTINQYLASLPPLGTSSGGDGSGDSSTPVLVIALPVALGGSALIAALAALFWWSRRRRQHALMAAERERAAAKARDLEAAHKGGLGSHSSSKDSTPAGSTPHGAGSRMPRMHNDMHDHGTADSFRYETDAELGRCLVRHEGASGAGTGTSFGSGSVIEGTMEDGSVCTVEVGPSLGQGSFGVVFKGVWKCQVVAVKVIVCSRNAVESVGNEVRLMTSEACRHPNLLRAHACMTRTKIVNRAALASQSLESTLTGLSSNKSSQMSGTNNMARPIDMAETWIISEYCDLGAASMHVYGKRFLDCGRPQMPRVLRLLRDVAAGMAHLHSLNVVHGDLKLANVLLSSGAEASVCDAACFSSASNVPALPDNMVAKVADFGLSRYLQEGQTHHSTKTVGTVTHMPPELLRNGKLTLSGDVYSFGIMCWEMCAGSVPYKGLMYGEVVERVVVSNRRPEWPQCTPAAFRELAERCWAVDAAVRPTFTQVLEELEALVLVAEKLQEECDALPMMPSMAATVSMCLQDTEALPASL